ncbi:hypothetical protein [Streptomyces sp. NPDC004546]|uniref:hypothetical protein n=1 Tax=unclassified Streptomyces TaxID=2593676 RepID=UPI0033A36C06
MHDRDGAGSARRDFRTCGCQAAAPGSRTGRDPADSWNNLALRKAARHPGAAYGQALVPTGLGATQFSIPQKLGTQEQITTSDCPPSRRPTGRQRDLSFRLRAVALPAPLAPGFGLGLCELVA